MQAFGMVVCGVFRATFIPFMLCRHSGGASTLRCFSAPDQVGFIRDVAVTHPPVHLPQLLNVIQARGDKIVSPGAKNGIILLVIPLAKNSSGARCLSSPEDVLERKVMKHFENGDHVSALVTGEFYTKKENFPGFARPFVFNAEILLKVGCNVEAKDAARGALKSPWWTLGCKYEDVADIAEWEDEQIKYIKEKITEEGRQEDLKKGKPLEQIVLDEAAFLLDLASIDGTWDDSMERIAECYDKAGLPADLSSTETEHQVITFVVTE